MADPFSTRGTVVGVISLGLDVCRGIIEFYSHWKDFESDIKYTQKTVMHLRKTLELLYDRVRSDLSTGDAVASQIRSTVETCSESILKLRKRADKINSFRQSQTQSGTSTSIVSTPSLQAAATDIRFQGQRLSYPFRHGTLRKLRDTVAELRAQLQPALVLLGLGVTADTLLETKELRADQQAWRAEKENQSILSWLSPLDFAARQQSMLAKRYPNTVSWFTESPAFVAWSQGGDNAPPGLWCQGRMGSGKSVLAATAIQHLKTTRPDEITIAYIYCDWQDGKAQSLPAMLGSLLRQCVESCSEIPPSVRKCYARHKNGKLPLETTDISTLIKDVREYLSSIFIVVDGLDECACDDGSVTDPSRMIAFEAALDAWLLESATSSSSKTRLLVTSRFDPQQATATRFEKVEVRATQDDLRSFVRGTLLSSNWASPWASPALSQVVQDDHDLQEKIIQSCLNYADATYLTSQLQIAHLKSVLNGRQLHRAMRFPPVDLSSSINACILRIKNQGENLRQLGAQILMWLRCSFRPMRIRELQHALNVELGDENFVEDGVCAVDVLIASCAGLVVLEETTNHIRFVNFSVKEHLDSAVDNMTSARSHRLITNICTTYLKFRCFDLVEEEVHPLFTNGHKPKFVITQKMIDVWFTTNSFLQYAARYWAEHAILAGEDNLTESLSRLLLHDSKATFLHTVYYAVIFKGIESCPRRVRGIHVAACQGLSRITKALLEDFNHTDHKNSVDDPDSFGRTALWLAASRGHDHIVADLLASAADFSGRWNFNGVWRSSKEWWLPAWARDDYTAEALEVAVEGGHLQVISLLLAARKPTGFGTGVCGGPIEAAAFKGHHEIVRTLLEAQIPLESSAVQAAVYGGNTHTFRLVLDNWLMSADRDMLKSFAQHPLLSSGTVGLRNLGPTRLPLSDSDVLAMAMYAAALANRMEIAETLFDYEIDVNAITSGYHATALAAASAYGYPEMVQLLLDKGADVNLMHPPYEPPGTRVHGRWNHRRVEVTGRHSTALQASAFAGYVDVVHILLNHGADVNAPPGYFGTALQAAAICGNEQIVDMLIDRGAVIDTSCGFYGNPTQAAAFNGHSGVLKKLISAGADVNLEGGRYGFSIVAAATNGFLDCLLLLIDAGADVSSCMQGNMCALQAASRASSGRVYREVKTLPLRMGSAPAPAPAPAPDPPYSTRELDDFLKLKENPRCLPPMGCNYPPGPDARQTAGEIFHPDASRLILEPIRNASDGGSVLCARVLLEHHAMPDVIDNQFEPPLFSAIRNESLNMVKELLDGGADISIVWDIRTRRDEMSRTRAQNSFHHTHQDGGGAMRVEPTTALSLAVHAKNHVMARYLLSRGAEVNDRNVPGDRSLLHLCGDSSMMALLINHGAEVDRPNRWGSTALHRAASHGSFEMVDLLVRAGARVSPSNHRQSTPMHELMRANSLRHGSLAKQQEKEREDRQFRRKVKILLDAGADMNARDDRDRTPLDWCRILGKDELLMLLQSDVEDSAWTRMLRRIVLPSLPDEFSSSRDVAQWLVDHRGTSLHSGICPELSPKEFTAVPPASITVGNITVCGRFENPESLKAFGTSVESARAAVLLDTRYLVRLQQAEDTHILVCLATNGPDDVDRLDFLIQNDIDLARFGSGALIRAICNRNVQIATRLLDHGVSVSLTAVREALWNLVKLKPTSGADGMTDVLSDEERLNDEIVANEVWSQLCRRIALAEESALR